MYNKLSPILIEKKILYDTCGVLNLHGVPGLLGGFISAINIAASSEHSFKPVTLEHVLPELVILIFLILLKKCF